MVDRLAGDKVSSTFCVLPWIHRFTNIGGEHQVCCTAEEYHAAIPDADGTPLNISNCQDDQRIMNTPFMKDLRKDMLAGRRHAICERCRQTEDDGGHSRRVFENERYTDLVDGLVSSTDADGGILAQIRSADFRLGNLCNLACRMCNPRSSSKWIADWKHVEHRSFAQTESELEVYRHYDWYKSPELWNSFRQQIPHLRHLHFAGGEPLLIPQMIELLEACVESGCAKNIELTYNTNVTRIPPKIRTLWPNFRLVKILASIDGFGGLNEFIRYPSQWSVIDANLRDLDQSFDELGLSDVILMVTVQAYNVLQLAPLYEYLASSFKRVACLPHLINLHHPNLLRTQILTPSLKAKASESLRAIRVAAERRFDSGVFGPQYRHNLASIDEAIHFMNAEDRTALIPDFLGLSSSIDRLRKQDTFLAIPELAELRAPA